MMDRVLPLIPRIAAVAGVLLVGASPPVLANGRFPATVSVRFQPGNNDLMLVPSTFGLLLSQDGGESFHWVCEKAIGYGGTYDPDYAITSDGMIYATTFEGLRRSNDAGCTWNTITGALDGQWVGEVEIGPNGRVWAITATGGAANDVYAADDGETFVSQGMVNDRAWWRSIRVAPSDPARVYLTGYLLPPSAPDADAGPADAPPRPPAQALLYRSDDGGQQWIPLDVDQFAFGREPNLYVVGIHPDKPDIVFARVFGAHEPLGDDLYRSSDAGQNWTRVIEFSDTLRAFEVRKTGDVVAGTAQMCPGDPPENAKGCVYVSTNEGQTFELATSQPQMGCVGERADGTLFSCGNNWEPDLFALAQSTTGQSWDKVLRFSELAGPLTCPDQTIQAQCASIDWPPLCQTFGICTIAGADAGMEGEQPKGCAGCVVVVAPLVLLRRRRRRRRRRR